MTLPLLALDEATSEELSPIQQTAKNLSDWQHFSLSGPIISSLTVMVIVCILMFIIGIEAKVQDPLKKPKGLLYFAEWGVDVLNGWCRNMMGVEPGNWPGYFMGLFVYLFISFIWSITGFPSVIDYLVCPFVLSCVMFVLIQHTALRYQHFHYFHRYIEPIVIWLPINLVTMWSPIISTSLRMFGNCLSGSVIIGLINWAMKKASLAIFSFIPQQAGQIVLGPVLIGVLNLYFGLFSGFVQTLVFASLNGVWIGQEIPEGTPMGIEGQVSRSPVDQAN